MKSCLFSMCWWNVTALGFLSRYLESLRTSADIHTWIRYTLQHTKGPWCSPYCSVPTGFVPSLFIFHLTFNVCSVSCREGATGIPSCPSWNASWSGLTQPHHNVQNGPIYHKCLVWVRLWPVFCTSMTFPWLMYSHASWNTLLWKTYYEKSAFLVWFTKFHARTAIVSTSVYLETSSDGSNSTVMTWKIKEYLPIPSPNMRKL